MQNRKTQHVIQEVGWDRLFVLHTPPEIVFIDDTEKPPERVAA